MTPADAGESPLVEHLREVQRAERASFHMPGHKGGRGAPAAGRSLFGDAVYEADVSEMGGFDYLHHPESAILGAQARAATLLGASRSWFLVNGATAGNLAAICATVGDGDTLLVARGSHRSVYAALALSGARPLYLPPVVHPEIDGLFGVDPAGVAAALVAHPEIRAVHVTSPSYYGFCLDLEEIRDLTRAASIPLLVDEAHGSHFALHPALPTPALALGADLVVQSPHKSLGSFTQSSLLHHQGALVDAERVDGLLQMLQSSSPSSLLLVSLDLALDEAGRTGHERWGRAIALGERLRAAGGTLEPLTVYGDELRGRPGVADYDPTKVVVDVARAAIGAPEAASWLARERHLRPEFSDLRRMVFSLTAADDDECAAVLLEALGALAAATREGDAVAPLASLWPDAAPEMARTPRAGTMTPRDGAEAVGRRRAAGRIAAEMVVPYPPGIPLLVPGEVISTALLEALDQLLAAHCRIVGTADPSAETIRCAPRARR